LGPQKNKVIPSPSFLDDELTKNPCLIFG